MGLSRCKLSDKVQLKLLEMFVGQVTARTAADLTGINYHTAHLFYHKLRVLITNKMIDEEPFDGEIELDESYFGGIRKGKRGRGAAGKVPVFGLLKRGGKVYAAMVEDTKSRTLMPVIRRKIQPDSIVYTDSYRSYNVLDVSEFKHYRINHSTDFVTGQTHINGIEKLAATRRPSGLESIKTCLAEVQWYPETKLCLLSSGVRLQVQLWLTKRPDDNTQTLG